MANLFEKLAGNLLDLGLRNKLLNFKDQKLRSIEIVEPDSDEIFNLVCSDSPLYFIDSEEDEDDNEGAIVSLELFEQEQVIRKDNELVVHKKGESADYILRRIKKFNDSAIIEKGINILYLAFGFLKWKEAEFSKNDLKSPLLLVPVSLDFNKEKQQFYIKRLEEEVVVNPALKAKLEFDFDMVLPDFSPDEDNIETYLSKVEERLTEDGWSIDNKTYLGLFSFAKLTMYNDLKVNEDKMSSCRLVKAIYEGDNEQYETSFDTNYDEFFNKGEDVKLYNVVDADSSQIEAILEAKKGKSFVIQGPPGTGKSQTITNIIAELLNDGKKVLFVSEKKAALDVVYNNMKKVGLGDFCFQVHSDKMNKKEFVGELYRVLNTANKGTSSRSQMLEELESKKSKLDTYCKTLYQNVEPLNLRIYDLLNAVYLYRKYENVDYKIPDIKSKDMQYLAQCKNALENYAVYDGPADCTYSPWFGFNSEKYNYQNDREIKELFEFSSQYVKDLSKITEIIGTVLGSQPETVEELKELCISHSYLLELPYLDRAILNSRKRQKLIFDFSELNKAYKTLESSKNGALKVFDESIFDFDIESVKTRFLNEYRSVFRVFNQSYKNDKLELSKKLSKVVKKFRFAAVKSALLDVSNYNEQNKKIISLIEEIEATTSYNYNLRDEESISKYIERIKNFDRQYQSVNLYFGEDVDIEKVVNSVFEGNRLLTSESCEKYGKTQEFFIKEYFEFAHKTFENIINKLDSCCAYMQGLVEWVRFCSVWLPVERLGLSEFIKSSTEAGVEKSNLPDAFSYCFYRDWMMISYYENDVLKYFRRSTQDLTVKQFKDLDKQLLNLDRKEIACRIKQKIYDHINGLSHNSYTELQKARQQLYVLNHEANKKRAIKPIRVMFREIPDLIYCIKPCLLMSPLSVATYLAYNPQAFDVVIFDEASQIFPWDAIGAISRSTSTIVVGDSKQMPPSNFFMASTGADDEYDEEEEESATDYESILDLCTAVLPQKMLNWHYRSKTESLIAFSNRNFYRNRLVTFPSSQHDSDDFGIKFHYVKSGVFVNRQNVKEAEMVAQLVYEHFKKHPERSLGVVCFSINQQMLLEDIIEEMRRRSDPYAAFFDQSINEPFFIKNLETVQGDERDTIIFSIGYGKDPAGNLKHNFGPLNRKGGERRLNVAITRAKFNVQVVSSIKSIDIDLNRTSAEGARLLKEYLDLAENGITVLNKDLYVDPNAEADSYFEEDVANVVRDAGYKVDLQVGCSGYRIDLCVRHPANNDYVLAIECDGRTYHSSRNARDRDRLRQEVLERLGWKFYRIWSTDWFINREAEKKALLERIEKAVLDYDIVAKEIEERNKVVAEERSKEAEEHELIASKQIERDETPDKERFSDLLSAEEIKYLKNFNSELEKTPYKFIFKEKENVFSYKLKSDFDLGKRKSWFWIGKKDDRFFLKLKDDPDDSQVIKDVSIGKAGREKALAEFIVSYCEKKQKPKDNKPKPKSIDELEDSEEETSRNEPLKNERFLFNVAKAIQGRRVFCRSAEESNVINEVLECVLNQISYAAISKGFFKNKKEFDEYKYSRRLTYSFFTVTFSLGNISTAKAEEIYYYYVATKAVKVIKSYEKIFNKQIVTDDLTLIESLFQMIRANDISISRCSGLSSNITLVPESTVIDEIEKYLSYCRFN